MAIGCAPRVGVERADDQVSRAVRLDGAVRRDARVRVDAGAASVPRDLERYAIGDPADAQPPRTGPALVLSGGGDDVDEAFAWWRPFLGGGDVVVLRATGGDAYNDYFYRTIGGADSVETLVVDRTALANSGYVARRVREAEGIFIAGGDQAAYVRAWANTALAAALQAAWDGGAAIGGTSAGLAILGGFVFTAEEGSLGSREALADPYDDALTLAPALVAIPWLRDVVTDSHFAGRDRMGRAIAFLARIGREGWALEPRALGIDEGTALVIGPGGSAQVFGRGSVYLLGGSEVVRCEPRRPLEITGVTRWRVRAGERFEWNAPPGTPRTFAVADGRIDPRDVYD